MKLSIKQFNPCHEGLEYYESFEEAWNKCKHGDRMLAMARKLNVDKRSFIRAKALCANTVRHLMKDKRSTDAVDAALRYANGEISRKELDKYKVAAFSTAAFAADYAAAYAVRADSAVHVAYFAARAAGNASDDADAAKEFNLLQTADICREVLAEEVFKRVKELQNKQL
jgi:hypothetical protein